jgi:hypothetical protein
MTSSTIQEKVLEIHSNTNLNYKFKRPVAKVNNRENTSTHIIEGVTKNQYH